MMISTFARACSAAAPQRPSLRLGAAKLSTPAATLRLARPAHSLARRQVQVTASAESRPTASRVPVEPPVPSKGHAVLHDFCMAIPYGAFALVAGLISMVAGTSSSFGPWLAAGGTVICAASALSLKVWKKRENNTPYTLASAGVAGALCALMVKTAAAPLSGASGIAAVSGALALFLVYNIIAGGNPPPSSAASA